MQAASLSRDQVVIVTPAHKPTLTPLERMSLARCQRVLPDYPKVLMCPEGMATAAHEELLQGVRVREFDPSHFGSVRTYSRLLRSPAFYEPFLDHEYMLIYQPDCYVFEDRLDEFCGQPYDYIGAPWLHFDWLSARRRWAKPLTLFPWLFNPVGNGGLSLRRTRALYESARRFQALGSRLDLQEDLYFCNVVARLDRTFRVAGFDDALRFAFEHAPRQCYELAGRRLPFGCHAFERYEFSFWREHFDPEELRLAGQVPLPPSGDTPR